MQSQLEVKSITKRIKDIAKNGEKLFGVNGNQTKGSNVYDEYDIEGSKNRKGNNDQGALVDHLHSFDISVGGDNEDFKARERQLGYQIPGLNKYDKENTYSDADTENAVTLVIAK